MSKSRRIPRPARAPRESNIYDVAARVLTAQGDASATVVAELLSQAEAMRLGLGVARPEAPPPVEIIPTAAPSRGSAASEHAAHIGRAVVNLGIWMREGKGRRVELGCMVNQAAGTELWRVVLTEHGEPVCGCDDVFPVAVRAVLSQAKELGK